MNPPELVLFDLDDTLFAHRAAVEAGILRYTASLGEPYGRLDAAAGTTWRRSTTTPISPGASTSRASGRPGRATSPPITG
ncbi:hypothetical protein LLS1_37990 [Leifsonia sp. LS1]|nr:hypothetical protein LLS1_37990 [Leifsonia sp. LS1]